MISHENYFYNCTNPYEVIFKGKTPNFTEFGPYYYHENQIVKNI